MKCVFAAANLVEAECLTQFLQDNDIESVVQGRSLSTVLSSETLFNSPPEVWVVKDENEAKARDLILQFFERKRLAGKELSRWTCPGCGEEVADQFTSCWKCTEPRCAEDSMPGPTKADDAGAPKPSRPPDRLDQPASSMLLMTGMVLLVGWAPAFFNSISALVWPELISKITFKCDMVSLMALHIAPIGVTLCLIAQRREGWGKFGFRPFRVIADPLSGFGIWLLGIVCFNAAIQFLYQMGLGGLIASGDRYHTPLPIDYLDYGLLIAASFANGFGEELVMRGFLLPQFETLLRSTWKSLLITAALFASYHVYQGALGVSYVFFIGLLYGTIFWVTRRLWPLVLAHAIADFASISEIHF